MRTWVERRKAIANIAIETKRELLLNQAIKYPVMVDNVPSPNAIHIIKIAPWLEETSRLYSPGTASSNGKSDERQVPKAIMLNPQANPGKFMKISKQAIIAQKQRQ